MNNIENTINRVEITVDDLLAAAEQVRQLPAENRNGLGRALCMAMIFKENHHKAMAVDSRLVAMNDMVKGGHLPGWAVPEGEDGSISIAEPVWEATAKEPLIFIDNEGAFNRKSFLNRILLCAEPEGNA